MLLLGLSKLVVREEEHVKFASILNLKLVSVALRLFNFLSRVVLGTLKNVDGLSEHAHIQLLLR